MTKLQSVRGGIPVGAAVVAGFDEDGLIALLVGGEVPLTVKGGLVDEGTGPVVVNAPPPVLPEFAPVVTITLEPDPVDPGNPPPAR